MPAFDVDDVEDVSHHLLLQAEVLPVACTERRRRIHLEQPGPEFFVHEHVVPK